MLHFEGTEQFECDPAAVYAYLANPARLARAIPEHQVTAEAADSATWKVRPKFAFMAGTLDTTATVAGREPDRQVRYTVVSKGVGSSSTVQAVLTFVPADITCTVEWVADLTELGGLLKLAPRGLMQAAAQSVIAEVWAAVGAKLAAG